MRTKFRSLTKPKKERLNRASYGLKRYGPIYISHPEIPAKIFYTYRFLATVWLPVRFLSLGLELRLLPPPRAEKRPLPRELPPNLFSEPPPP